METKQLIFILLTLGFIPCAMWAGATFRLAERLLVAGAFFSTAYLIDINFVSMEFYRGDTRGFEFGVTDCMILSLLGVMLISPRWRSKPFKFLPPNSSWLLLYLLIAIISTTVAYVTVYAQFGLMKIIRGLVVFMVAYNYLQDEDDLRFVTYILAAIVCMEMLMVMDQRLSGIYRAFGSTPHSNTLAGYINMVNMIFFSLLLGEKRNSKLYWAVLAMGSLMVLATFSRGSIAAMITGYLLVIALSYRHKFTVRKGQILLLMAAMSLPVVIKTGPALVERFLYAPEESGESRGLANTAAIAMANEHWLGVGLNNYSYVINETVYIDYIESEVDRGIVHNIFLLHACEMGWIGMIVFIILTLNFMRLGYKALVSTRSSLIGAYAIGITAAIFVLTIQGSLEWFFRQTYITIEFFMLSGFLMALGKVNIRKEKSEKVQNLIRSMVLNRSFKPNPGSALSQASTIGH